MNQETRQLKIAIIGPGAMGCLFAGLFGQVGHEIWLIDHQPNRARRLVRRGLWVSGVLGEFNAHVHATTTPRDVGTTDLVIIAVKAYDTGAAALVAQSLLGPDTPVLTLQNGLGNVEMLAQVLGQDRIVGGVTSEAATLLSPGQVHHAGTGRTTIGELSGLLTDRLTAIAEVFAAAGLHVDFTTDLPSVLWGKLVVNAGINAVATLAQVRNGGIIESANLRQVMASAVTEASLVATAHKIRLPNPDMVGYAEEICQRTANNINSMLQDIYRQRRTEVDAINGAIVKESQAASVATPTNQALVWLIHGLEETHAARVSH